LRGTRFIRPRRLQTTCASPARLLNALPISWSRGCVRAFAVPANFGGRDGLCITNKATALSEVDDALGLGRPPDLEAIYQILALPTIHSRELGLLMAGSVSVPLYW